jgi:hypothetical protein
VREIELEAVHWLRWDFRVTSGGSPLTTLKLPRFRDRASFTLQGQRYDVRRTGLIQPTYHLERGPMSVARAETRGFFRRTFAVTTRDRTISLVERGLLGHTFTVEHGRTALGEIRRPNVLKRGAVATLDERIDLPAAIFLLILVQLEWRRAARRHGERIPGRARQVYPAAPTGAARQSPRRQRTMSEATSSWADQVKKVISDRAYSLNYDVGMQCRFMPVKSEQGAHTIEILMETTHLGHPFDLQWFVRYADEGGLLWREDHQSLDRLRADAEALPVFIRGYFVGRNAVLAAQTSAPQSG